jgi:hypothetical protein
MARRADPDRSANHSRRRGDCSRPGIESLLIGTSDLSMELGIPGQFGDERFVDDHTLSSMRATPMGSSRE